MKHRKLLLVVPLFVVFSVLFFSCVHHKVDFFSEIRICDENNVLMRTKEKLREFNVTVVDGDINGKYSPRIRTYERRRIAYYAVSFELHETGTQSQVDKAWSEFRSEIKDIRIRIEDKMGRYKTKEIYPFRTEEGDLVVAGIISVKLEKK